MPPKTQKSARKKGKANTNFNKKQAPKFSKNSGNKQSAKNKPAIKRQPTETARTKNQTDKQSRDSVSMPIQWFPGHMAKTRRKITESLTKVDAVCEIVDARIPNSSRNPELSDIIQKKPRIILLNKSDMADPNVTALWQKHFTAQNNIALAVDCRSGKGMKQFAPAVNKLLEKQIAANVAKGMAGKAIRLMIVGIPNVGKSSFINRLTGAKRAKVEDRPGVTRDNQWFVADEHLQLLDTPGVLWPKFEDQTVGEHLAFTGAVKDAILDIETLAVKLLAVLRKLYPELLCNRYKIEINAADSDYDLLCKIAQKRGMVVRGGEVDTERAATMLLDEYRGGVLGKITLERPEEF